MQGSTVEYLNKQNSEAILMKKNFDMERQGYLEELRESRYVKQTAEKEIALFRLHDFVFRWCTIAKLRKFQSFHTHSLEQMEKIKFFEESLKLSVDEKVRI
jgi:hypothetical protein